MSKLMNTYSFIKDNIADNRMDAQMKFVNDVIIYLLKNSIPLSLVLHPF